MQNPFSSKMILRILNLTSIVLVLGYFSSYASASTVNAASCSQTDVQNAINSASMGDTIIVPAGNCTWTGVSLKKAVVLQGAGAGQTNITINGNQRFTITKQVAGIIRVQGFSFSASNLSGLPDPIVIDGAWLGTQPVIIQNNSFTMSGSSMFSIGVAGGLIFSHNTFTGGWMDFAFSVKDLSNLNSWTTADSMGTRDTDGTKNIYIEDNTFNGQSNGTIDCDDNCRVVMRHNSFIESGGYNSHGADSSPYGARHFEIYSNSFTFPDVTCTNGNNSLSNINQYIWVRGGTGVIFDNSFATLSSSCWGRKTEVKLSIRGAEDDRPQGTCAQVTYPVPHQLGQSNNGTTDITDPIYFWGNTGTMQIAGGWGWGNPCGFTWTTFFQWGRDGINPNATGGTAKPAYAPYAYPHPLISSGTLRDSTPPSVSISLQ